tara:strand:- start:282 stop:1250 length:969 start_codon:yes stop_codon:yes gene_type:complete
MATNTSTQTQTVRLAPFQEEFLADIFASGKALTSEGSQMPYSAQQLANLSPAQQQAISSAMGGVGSYAPYLQKGAEALGQGIGAVGAGLGTIGSAIGQAGQASYDPNSYQQFMDPYMDDVIQQQYQDIADQGQKQQNQLSGNAISAGAFGGSRQGVAQGEIAGSVMDQQARTGSQLRSQGFAQAQGAAQQAAQQQLRQAQLTGQLGQTAGQLGQSIGQLGMSTAGLGQLGQQMGVQDINSLMGVGSLQQGQTQRGYDVTRANELAQQALPYQQVGFMSDLFRGVPALQQTYSTSTAPPPSTQSQLYGLGIAGIGAYGMANKQ